MENLKNLKTVIYLGVCLSAGILTPAETAKPKAAQNVRWVSLDFKTVLTWTAEPSDYRFTVLYSSDDSDWLENPDCSQKSESECDLTVHLDPRDRSYIAKIQTEPAISDYDNVLEEFPHAFSPDFNPYKESNISAVNFTVATINGSRVQINISDPLSGVHRQGKQLSIRDVLKKDLKYKISYHKSRSTGKRDIIFDSSPAEVSQLDAGESYCFMVAAFIPSRPKRSQQGAWSIEYCTPRGDNIAEELTLGAWVGAIFILLTVLIIIVTVTVLCCRCCRQNRNQSQSSAPV